MTIDSPEQLAELRRQVRATVEQWGANGRLRPGCDAWLRGHDLEFTRLLAEHGWLGITWPVEFGGSARSNRSRLVVTEELLRAGAPVAAHWIADRQIGPAILRYGSAELQREFLPRIASGEVTFCLGMSETESGSDLASVRTTAVEDGDDWLITGRKIWTSQAHRSTHAYVLARTSKGERKQEGLTEFVVDMSAVGVEVRPILDLSGEHHFNEVTFDEVRVPGGHVLGEVGNGWDQVTQQLSFERGGMERVLSTYPLLAALLDEVADAGELAEHVAVELGESLARLATLRTMAWQIADALDHGEAPVQRAAMLKDLGTVYEGEVNELARRLLDVEPDLDADGPAALLAQGILAAPGFTIRGGTTEVLRTIIARSATAGMPRSGRAEDDELREVVDDVLADAGPDRDPSLPTSWTTVQELGWPQVGIPEERGGAGGTFGHLAALAEGLGRRTAPVPLIETALAGRLLAGSGRPVPQGAATVVLPGPGDDLRVQEAGGDTFLSGTATRVPWASEATQLLVCARRDDGSEVVLALPADTDGVEVTAGRNLADEPRDAVTFDRVKIGPDTVLEDAPQHELVRALAALLRACATVGALENVYESTRQHVRDREQFGRPLVAFQAVAHSLAVIASELTLARTAVDAAVDVAVGVTDPVADGDDLVDHVAIARAITGTAATRVARAAHQLHGAMGITREHALHLGTRRLWSWRDEWGTQRQWSATLGRRLGGYGSDHAWRWLTSRSDGEQVDRRRT